MKNFTRNDIVQKVVEESGLSQLKAFNIVQRVLSEITEAVARGQKIELRNFGVFEVRLTRPKVGRNPKRPENSVVIPARAVVKFSAGKVMGERVLLLTEELKKTMVAE